MKTISFIIPAHNAEHVLKRAAESVARIAGTSDYELILVENGSEDRTMDVLSALAAQDSHIIPAHSETGVSNARNEGIRLASGKWIAFLDADDAFTEEAARMMEDAEESDADLLCYGHIRSGVPHPVTEEKKKEVFEGPSKIEKMRIRMLKAPTRYMQAWAKLFRASVIKEHQLAFDPELRLAEDSDFTFRYTKHCQKAVFSEKCVYRYFVNADSVMRTGDGSKIRDYARAMKKMARITEDMGESQEIREAVNEYILNHFNIAMVREVFAPSSDLSYGMKRVQMMMACRIPVFGRAISRTKFPGKHLRLMPAWLLKKRMPDAAALIFMARAEQNRREEEKTEY